MLQRARDIEGECVCVCVRGFLTHPVLPPSVLRTGINECTDGHSLISSNRQQRKKPHEDKPADMLTIIITRRVQVRAETTGDASSCEDLPGTPKTAERISVTLSEGFL